MDYSNVYRRDLEMSFWEANKSFINCNPCLFTSATDYVAKATRHMEEEKEYSVSLGLPSTMEARLI